MVVRQTHGRGSGGRPPAHEIEARRAHLITVATGLFLTNGYEATSLEQIAATAGVSKATIYRNFGDKAELFGFILKQSVEPVWPTLSDLSTEGRSPTEILTSFAYMMISATTNPEAIALLHLVYHEALQFPELARMFADAEKATIEKVAGYLELATSQKLLSVSDPRWAATQFLELVCGNLVRRLVMRVIDFPDDTERQRIADAAVSLFLHGSLGPGAAKDRPSGG